MSLTERLRRRGRTRFGGTWVASESVRIDSVTCREVWDLIRPAETAVTLAEATIRAYTEPGTEGGVGEVQVFVRVIDGVEDEHRIVVVEEEAPFLARSRCLHETDPGVTSYELAQVGDAVELRMTWAVELPAGQYVNPAYEEAWRDFARGYLGRVRSTLERRATD